MQSLVVDVKVPGSLPALVTALCRDGVIGIDVDSDGNVQSVNLGDVTKKLNELCVSAANGDEKKSSFYDVLQEQLVAELEGALKGEVLPLMP